MARRTLSTRRVAATTAIVAAGAILTGAVALGAFSVYVARRVVTPSKRRVEDLRILAVTADTVTLTATLDTLLPGTYSLWFGRGAGHAKIGDILGTTPTSVTRRLLAIDFGTLATSTRGYVAGWVYLDPAELSVPFEDVMIETPVGPAPAWLIPAAEGTERWVIAVHGRGVRRQETLRGVEVIRRCGYSALLVSYRNDGDAPDSDDGRYGLGDTEWRDVEAAVEFAIGRGATEIVLMGWSMGGATVLQVATRSRHSAVIRGLILESPVIDWFSTLTFQAELLRIPSAIGSVATGLISRRWSGRLTGQAEPIPLDRLDFVTRADDLALPILILHSVDDGFVPVGSSRALADARPDIVSYDEFTVARHTKLWNYDPDRWNADIGTWLSRL